MKVETGTFTEDYPLVSLRKPSWLKKKIELNKCFEFKKVLREFNLYTICEEAHCPNISECFSKKSLTFLILGNTCSKGCRFCSLKKGKPLVPDPEEPQRISRVVKILKINWVVLTSPCREDLEDKGVNQFIKTIEEVRKQSPQTIIELLIPDFSLDKNLLSQLIKSKPQIIGHNLETVQRLYPLIKLEGSYSRSLELFKLIKTQDSKIYTKSGLILGLGEKKEEVIKTFLDLRRVDCDFLSIGQYLPSSLNNLPVKEYISPQEFKQYKRIAQKLGFKYVESSPYTRSSYKAKDYLNGRYF